MDLRIRVIAIAAAVLLVGCAAEEPQKDADWHPDRIYRTGSNIPVKDYGAANIEVGKPEAANPAFRPGTNVLGRKPGG